MAWALVATGLALTVSAAAFSAPAGAVPQTDSIPLATTPAAPPTRTGTLPNGVTWSVDRGTWNAGGQGFVVFGGATQTWTFSQTVALRFSVRGLTGQGECMQVPVGSALVSVAPSHTYNPATRLVCYRSNVPSADSFFTLAATTSLVLVAVNDRTLGRGPGSIAVTFDPDPTTTTTAAPTTTTAPTTTPTTPAPTTAAPPAATTTPEPTTTFAPSSTATATSTTVPDPVITDPGSDVAPTVATARDRTAEQAQELPETGWDPSRLAVLAAVLVAVGALLAARRGPDHADEVIRGRAGARERQK